MKIKKNAVAQLVNNLPAEIIIKDMWDNPEKIAGQGVRLRSVDANADAMNFHFERYGVEGFQPQFRPDWDVTAVKTDIKSDPELSVWYSICEIAVNVMSAILWQRRVNASQLANPNGVKPPEVPKAPTAGTQQPAPVGYYLQPPPPQDPVNLQPGLPA